MAYTGNGSCIEDGCNAYASSSSHVNNEPVTKRQPKGPCCEDWRAERRLHSASQLLGMPPKSEPDINTLTTIVFQSYSREDAGPGLLLLSFRV